MTEPKMISLADLLGGPKDDRPAFDRVHERQNALRSRFKPEEAAEMLRAARAVLLAEHKFEPGQLVRRKRGLMDTRRESCGGVAIFMRYEAGRQELYNDFERGIPVEIYEEDCVLGVLQEDGSMGEYYNCSRYFEPWSPE